MRSTFDNHAARLHARLIQQALNHNAAGRLQHRHRRIGPVRQEGTRHLAHTQRQQAVDREPSRQAGAGAKHGERANSAEARLRAARVT